MKDVIERCDWLVNECNDKAITPDVKDDFRYLLEEIERLNSTINKIKSIIYNSFEYNALTKVALIRESLQGSGKE